MGELTLRRLAPCLDVLHFSSPSACVLFEHSGTYNETAAEGGTEEGDSRG
ncbi:MAG: hypothetical protein OEM22_02160 [Acidimicrobiia bacterium]|nr:hypothetical protein [Acidimicrobiia bacterium]MDH3470488.1 hypothetical protein [Acidimicrobiia bacterium]